MRQANKWVLGIIFLVIAVAGTLLYYLPINLGLDLKGGVHVVLQGQDTPQTKVTAETMKKAKLVIEKRVNSLGVSEPMIQIKGENQIIVDLPGMKDEQKALEMIGKTAVLEFRDPKGNTVVTGGELVSANLSQDNYGRWAVSFKMNPEGAAKFAAMTQANIGQQAPIVLDGNVISSPVIQSAIPDGEGEITGQFTVEEAKELVSLLQAGSLPVPLTVVENRSVGPTLGKTAVDMGMKAGIIGVIAVLLYMLAYYTVPGVVADMALLIYIFLVLGSMAAVRATLTLPGIAGMILSVGMAVDANVLIFERIKEEVRNGKNVRAAMDAGFHRAWSSILDSNVTTLITAAVLFFYGTSSVKGFAVTLGLGIVISLFTAITVTRTLLSIFVDRNPDAYKRYFGVRG